MNLTLYQKWWYGMILGKMILFHMSMILYKLIRYSVIWHFIIPYDVISYRMLFFRICWLFLFSFPSFFPFSLFAFYTFVLPLSISLTLSHTLSLSLSLSALCMCLAIFLSYFFLYVNLFSPLFSPLFQISVNDSNLRYAGYSAGFARAFRYLAFTSDFGEALRPVISSRLVLGEILL